MNTRPIMMLAALISLAFASVAQEKSENQTSFDGDVIPSNACADGNNDTECVIDIKVEDKNKDENGESCRITLLTPHQDLVTFGRGFADKFIYWRIKEQPVGNPYRFGLRDGIAFLDNPRPRTFVNLQRASKDPTSFRARNKHNRVKVFKYVVNVTNETEDASPTRECSLDPWFRNR